jgi:hypothetical protein
MWFHVQLASMVPPMAVTRSRQFPASWQWFIAAFRNIYNKSDHSHIPCKSGETTAFHHKRRYGIARQVHGRQDQHIRGTVICDSKGISRKRFGDEEPQAKVLKNMDEQNPLAPRHRKQEVCRFVRGDCKWYKTPLLTGGGIPLSWQAVPAHARYSRAPGEIQQRTFC